MFNMSAKKTAYKRGISGFILNFLVSCKVVTYTNFAAHLCKSDFKGVINPNRL